MVFGKHGGVLALVLPACPPSKEVPSGSAVRGIWHGLTSSSALQRCGNDKEDLHQHQGAMEAAERQQRLCQAEETHSHPPARQKAQQERDAAARHEVHQLPRQGAGRARPTADGSGSTRQPPGLLPASPTPAEHGGAGSG